MYYLIYDPEDNSSVQISTVNGNDLLATSWHYTEPPFWDTCKNEIVIPSSFSTPFNYQSWLIKQKFIELLVSEHAITSESHPELSL